MQTHVVTHHRRHNLQTGDDTVTGGGFIQQDNVAGVFRADTPAFLLQLLQT
jgi:hypothetical protein